MSVSKTILSETFSLGGALGSDEIGAKTPYAGGGVQVAKIQSRELIQRTLLARRTDAARIVTESLIDVGGLELQPARTPDFGRGRALSIGGDHLLALVENADESAYGAHRVSLRADSFLLNS